MLLPKTSPLLQARPKNARADGLFRRQRVGSRGSRIRDDEVIFEPAYARHPTCDALGEAARGVGGDGAPQRDGALPRLYFEVEGPQGCGRLSSDAANPSSALIITRSRPSSS